MRNIAPISSAFASLLLSAGLGCSDGGAGSTPGQGGASSMGSGGSTSSGGNTSANGGASAGTTSGGASSGGSGSGGTANGGSGNGGATGSGGTSGGGSGLGGSSSGGKSSSGGSADGGKSSGGKSSNGGNAGSSTGGSTSAGGSSTAGASSGGSTSSTATPSAGCSKASPRPANGTVTASDRIYNFPEAYDGKTPMPLLLGLHAAGNPNTQIQSLIKGSGLEKNYVRAFPKSAGSAWVYSTDVSKVNAVLDDLLTNYCIDTKRIFATGHSSGAQMVVQLLCNGEKRFKAVAPVAASKYCNKVSPIPVMYIQGQMDAQRGGGNGADVVALFTSSNSCSTTTTPKTDVLGCTSSFDRMAVTPGCVTYQGCMQPTVWCSHNDNGYNNTDGKQHGWPCFASSAITDFFASIP